MEARSQRRRPVLAVVESARRVDNVAYSSRYDVNPFMPHKRPERRARRPQPVAQRFVCRSFRCAAAVSVLANVTAEDEV